MNSSIFEQRSRFAMIGALMVIISLMFLFYMGSSLVSSTKKYLDNPEEFVFLPGEKQILWKRRIKPGKR